MQKTMDWFSYADSNFYIHKSKESTGRVVLNREFNVVNAFTLECSFCGPSQGTHKDSHFSQKLLIESGRLLGKSLFRTTDADCLKETMREIEEKIINGPSVTKGSA